jgi:hypothetical protein
MNYSFLLLAINMQNVQTVFHSGSWRAVCASERKERQSRWRCLAPADKERDSEAVCSVG